MSSPLRGPLFRRRRKMLPFFSCQRLRSVREKQRGEFINNHMKE